MPEPAGRGSAVTEGRFQGLPCRILQLPSGDCVTVLLHGAQVVSWVAGGRERLYLSPASRWDGQSAVRGGIPVCFPQFNQRGPAAGLPRHGFARQLPWVAGAVARVGHPESVGLCLTLHLATNAATQAYWPEHFVAELQVLLQAGQLRTTLTVHNTGTTPWAFTGALHSYLAVDDVGAATLHGLGGQPEWDAVTDGHGTAAEAQVFAGEFDRVYAAAAHPLALHGGAQILHIEQSQGWAQTVVWNPGAALCAQLPDMPADGWQHMLCVEAAQVQPPIGLAPGQAWEAWQALRVS